MFNRLTSSIDVTTGMKEFLRDFSVATLGGVMKCGGVTRIFYGYFGVISQ